MMNGRVELIDRADWLALDDDERGLIQEWADNLPIGMMYD